MTEPIRYVKDLGMWAFSRGSGTCLWSTPWCQRHCYNKKFYNVNPKLREVDEHDNAFWLKTDCDRFADHLYGLARTVVPRFRFAIRGEIWNDTLDVAVVYTIMQRMPETLFWIPTRAWQNLHMRLMIQEDIFKLPNQRVMASIDPTVSERDVTTLRKNGWSMLFVGDNDSPAQLELGPGGTCVEKPTARMHRCAKTWDQQQGACADCSEGCFSNEQVEVHLKLHR